MQNKANRDSVGRARRRRASTRLFLTPESLETRCLLSGATISDSGGFEGSNQTLQLGGKGGGTIKYSYEMYSIPDNFIIRYEGRNLLETGFVSGGRSGTVMVPKGNADTAQIIVATNDSGTAWDYTVTADACPDTTPFNIETASGDFTHTTDANGEPVCKGTGTIYIGRTDGLSRMIRVENATVSFDATEASVSGTVYAMMGAGEILNKPLFTGSFKLPFKTGVATAFSETATAGDYQLGGMDVDFTGLAINRDGLSLGAKFQLLQDLGVPQYLFSGPDALIVTQTDVRLGASLKFSAPTFKNFNLFGFLPVAEFSNFSIEFIAPEDAIKIQGKLAVDMKSKFNVGKITADLSGSNFIRIKGGKADLKGELTVETDLKTPDGWGLREVKLTIDTIAKDVGGSAKLEFPFGGKPIDATGTIGFRLPIPPLELNKLGLSVDNLNKPIPPFPEVFFQGIEGALDHLAKSDPEPAEVTGGFSLTLGPAAPSPVDIPDLDISSGSKVALLRLDLKGTISKEAVSGTSVLTFLVPKLAQSTGTGKVDWKNQTFEQSGSFTFLDGLIQTNDSFKADSRFNISLGGAASVNIPNFIPLFGGARIGSGNYLFNYTNNGTWSDDFVAGWGTIHVQKVGLDLTFADGFKVYFDGRIERIGVKNIPAGGASRSLMRSAGIQQNAPAVGSWDVEPDQPWVLLGADWTNDFDGEVPLRVRRPDGVWIDEADFEANGIALVDELSDSRTRVVVVAAPEPGTWQLEVGDPDGLLGDVSYSAASQAVAPTISVLTPSTTVPGGSVAINYSAVDPDSDAEVQLFYDEDGEGFDGIPIASGLPKGDGSYAWNTRGVAPGDYHIYAMAFDGDNPPVYCYAPGVVHVAEATDLASAVSVSPGTIVVGGQAVITFTVANAGPSPAHGVQTTGSIAATLEATGDEAWYTVTARAGDSFVFETSTDASSALDPALELFGPGGAGLDSNAGGASDNRNARIAFVAPSDGVYRLKVSAENDSAGSYSLLATLAVGDLESGASRAFEIGAAAPSTPGVWDVRQASRGDDFDTDASNNADAPSIFAQAPPVALPDLQVVARPITAGALGQSFTYEITITNAGPGPATNVVLTESIPYAAADYVSAQASQGTAWGYGGSVLAQLGTLDPGRTATLTITLRPFAAGALVSTTTIVSDQDDAQTLDNNLITVNPVNVVVPTAADLELALSVDQAAPRVGDEVEFQLTLVNQGPGVASGVQVTIALPSELEFLDAAPEQGSYDPASGVWDVGNLRDHLTRTLTLRARVKSTAIPIPVVAEVTRVAEADPDSTPNNRAVGEDDQASVVLADRRLTANLGLFVSGPSRVATPDEPFAYIIVVGNAGPDAAAPAVWATLPTNVELLSALVGSSYDAASRTVTIPLGALASGAQAQIALWVRPTAAAAGTTVWTPFALSSNVSDPDPSDDRPVFVATEIPTPARPERRADLHVASSVASARVVVGEATTLTLWIANKGPDAATNATLSIPVPWGMQFIDASADRGTVAFDGSSVSARIGSLAPGEAVAVTIRLRALAAGSPTLIATAGADQVDPDGHGDAAVSTVVVVAPTGPRATSLGREGFPPSTAAIVLNFDEPLAPAGAVDPTRYLVTTPGRDGRLGTDDDRFVAIASARLSRDGRSIALRPIVRLSPFGRYGLIVSGRAGGPTSLDGRLIDGDGDGVAGGDYYTTFGRESFLPPRRVPVVRPIPPRWSAQLRPSQVSAPSRRLPSVPAPRGGMRG